jgi:hypothetical protein
MKPILRALLGANAAALPHLFRSGPRAFARIAGEAYRAATRPYAAVGDVPEVSLGDLLGDRKPSVTLRASKYEDGMLPSEQALALGALLVADQPRCVLEIGTYMGHTTRLMAENLPNAAIHTVDLPESHQADPSADAPGMPKDDFHLIAKRVVGREFRGTPLEGRITQHFADSATWDFRKAGSPDFFFIDGAHTYEYCKSDSEKCYELGTAPATFVWHDCDAIHPGVVRFVMEWRALGRDIRRISGTPLAYWRREA